MPAPSLDTAVAEAAIAAADPAMAAVIEAAGPCTLRGRRAARRPHFETLAASIVYQQLAGRAAEVIWGRVRAVVEGPFTPEAVLEVPVEVLRAAGLSAAKARSLTDLATRITAGEVRLGRIGARSDDEIVAELSQVWGIGRWTAEMFLIFQLGRPDVWPTGDLGVRNGYAVAHGIDVAPTAGALEALGEVYRPWRTVAAWYCWRAVDTRLIAGSP